MSEFSIVLRIRHPNIDPAVISSKLELEPFRSWRAGEPRTTPTGTKLSGTWPDSAWNHVFSYEGESIGFFEKIKELVIDLLPQKDFLLRICAEGGFAEVYLQLPGDVNSGDSAEPDLLRQMAELGLKLGVEVFPEWRRDC